PTMHGRVKSIDTVKNTLTLTYKGKDGAEETTLTLPKGLKVIADDGLGTKKDKIREGKLTDLAEAAPVIVNLSVDRNTALGGSIGRGSVRPRGGGASGGRGSSAGASPRTREPRR